MMMVLCWKASSLAFTPHGDVMSEAVSHCLPHSDSGGDLAPSLGETGKNFPEEISIFTPKISDDFFLVIYHVFKIFPIFFRFSISLLCELSYMTISSREKPLFQEIIPWLHLFWLCSYFRHYFSKYWEDGCMGRPPTSNLGGPFSPAP